MPKIVDSIPRRSNGDASKYPWAEWFDGSIREFTEDDFKGNKTAAGFTSTARAAAGRMGKSEILVAIRGDSVFIGSRKAIEEASEVSDAAPVVKEKAAPKKKSVKKKSAKSAEATA